MTKFWPALGVVLAGLLASSPADAANCTIATTPVIFGSYNVFDAAPLDSTGTVRIQCNGGAKRIEIAIAPGQSGRTARRTLTQGMEALEYNLFMDPARTRIWGDGSQGAQPYYLGNPPNKTEVDVPIYGRIPPRQDISAGTYGDRVEVTLNF